MDFDSPGLSRKRNNLPLDGKEIMQNLQDSYGRKFSYLRLSVTDICNFHCTYCLPNGYEKKPNQPGFLNLYEIENLVSAFAEMGFTKVRLTGGEPTVRKDIIDIARIVSSTEGIKKVAITTNGYKLSQQVRDFKNAGITSLNVSIDSLNKENFKKITGHDKLDEILKGLDIAFALGFESIKINAVLMKDLNDHELQVFLNWIKDKPVSVRFIELMRTGKNIELFKKHYTSGTVLQQQLLELGWSQKTRAKDDGPAQEFTHPNYVGKIGVIAPYSKDFCSTCNRLRVSAIGALRLCLFGDGDYSIRDLIQSPDQKEELILKLKKILGLKEESHYLHEGKFGNTWNLSSIGG